MAYLLGFAQFPQTFPRRYVNTKTLQKEWKLSMQRCPSGGVVLGGILCLPDTAVRAESAKKTPPFGWCFWSGRRGSNSLPGIPRMAVAIRRSPASPLDLTHFAQVEAASSPVLRHIPKRIPHPVGWGILFGAGDEARTRYPASHEWLPPFAGALPDLRSNVLRTGRGSDFQPAHCLIPKEKIPS